MQPSDRSSLPQLVAVATAVPRHVIDQNVAAAAAQAAFGERIAGYAALSRVFASTGIERRYSVEPLDWFDETRDWPQRTASYLAGATALFADVASKALRAANLDASQIDTVITVSSTGIATPSLEARALPGLGFRPDVRRIPVFGLGCAGGVSGLAIASRIAAAEPGSTVLLVTIELCTLAFRRDRATKADLISTALFGDGAAAAIVRCGAGRAVGTIAGATEHLWPDTLDIMGWSTDDAGLGVILSRSLPDFIARNYRDVFDGALQRLGLTPADVDRVVCHPGGTKVLEAIETALEMPDAALAVERSVMRDFGNMSSPTVLFVLERTLASGFAGTALLAALGPGFTASFVAFDVARD
ncbi:MAG: type III polyketide synthase [Candidatus Elarobacter sp.]